MGVGGYMRDRYLVVNCPFCEERIGEPDTGKHLYIYGEGRGVHCFKCEFNTHRTIPLEVQELIEDADFLPEREVEDPEHVALRLRKEMADFQGVYNFPEAIAYLAERKVDPATANTLRLRYAKFGKYANRIIFPMYGPDQTVGYFTARSIFSYRKPTYMNPPVDKDGWVFPVMSDRRGETVVIVEGVFDAMAVSAAGYSAIAILGKRINSQQCRNIKGMFDAGHFDLAVVALDSDAFTSGITVGYDLSFYVPVQRVELPEGHDPARILQESDAASLRAFLTVGGSSLKEALTGESSAPIQRGTEGRSRRSQYRSGHRRK